MFIGWDNIWRPVQFGSSSFINYNLKCMHAYFGNVSNQFLKKCELLMLLSISVISGHREGLIHMKKILNRH